MHLEALDVIAILVEGTDALESDVGDLDSGAGVRAAVDVDRERQPVLRQAGLKLGDERCGAALRLDEGELAELDARARHRAAPEA